MDSLPIELLQLILEYCDPASVRALRLVTPTLADVGYAYLLPPTFTALPWRDDLARLRAIASHDRLHTSIKEITFNFTDIHLDNARHAAYYQNYLLEPERQTALLTHTWKTYEQFEKLRRTVPGFNTYDVTDVVAALRPLINLRHLAVTFRRSPYDLEVLHRALTVPECCKMDHASACKTLNTLLSALQQATAAHKADKAAAGSDSPGLSTFAVDRLPLEMFRQSSDRRLWFQCGGMFAGLKRLDLALDTSNATYPSARFKAVNGLGYVLRLAPQLTHLSLAFHNYVRPRDKFILSFLELLGESSFSLGSYPGRDASPHRGCAGAPRTRFSYAGLTDLKLEGIACDERELCVFLLRHAATLERLRLGGRGMARTAYEPPSGGISLFNGNFRSLFRRLRGRMSRLQRLHLEGDFECETILSHTAGSPTGSSNSSSDEEANGTGEPGGGAAAGNNTDGGLGGYMTGNARYERYLFYATTDDNWAPTPPPTRQTTNGFRNSANFEQYVLGVTDTYPDLSE
ncbi:hypothetical protein CMQ_2962 [Grosmannia clavigera kw1407]|uniref:F-box domain-containing protein n=1 Tax=Grosmannia clavigera (strain kw1407 / UAMH 11150) TaxID=655863 RepID=F0XGT9_GROCL|nr:uncharacterized protein CMQ_2962 [Grosmannia clavigera kw1407]EFX03033.1 hypothetical protein CMQ_2962 [Grosmannia clavigera kw1407]